MSRAREQLVCTKKWDVSRGRLQKGLVSRDVEKSICRGRLKKGLARDVEKKALVAGHAGG